MTGEGLELPTERGARVLRLIAGMAVAASLYALVWLTLSSDWPLSNLWIGGLSASVVFGLGPMMAFTPAQAPLIINAKGITAGRHGTTVRWDEIAFATVFGDRVLAVHQRAEDTAETDKSKPSLTYLHYQAPWLGKARRAARCREVASAVEQFAPGMYVTDEAEMRRRAGI